VTALLGLAALLLHAALMLAAAPVLVGLIRRIKARLLGRLGAPVTQPWRDLARLMRKEPVLAENASPLFILAPAIICAATIVAALFVPSFALGMSTAPLADLIVLAGLLALGRVVLTLAALDVGTAFGGIGASRESFFAAFAEPALMLVVLVLGLLCGTTNLNVIADTLRQFAPGLSVALGLALPATLLTALAEMGRLPVDNPATHLELTMVHEAMALEYSGRHLALIEYAASLRQLIWLSLIAAIYLPFGMAPEGAGPLAWGFGLLAWGGKLLVLSLALAVLEVCVAKMRVFRVPELLGLAVLLGLLASVFLFLGQGFA